MKRVRVVIADDSPTMRRALTAALSRDGRVDVIGEAKDGTEAIAIAKSMRPDVMTMDIQMPGLSGFDAISAIMGTAPVPIVVVASADNRIDVDLSFRAMAAGALEVITKPNADDEAGYTSFGRRVANAVVLMAEVPVVTRRRTWGVPVATEHVAATATIDVVGIASSTGGPAALSTILSSLPANFRVPIVVAQHLAVGFCDGLVRWLSENAALRVEIARQGELIRPGHVYVADAGTDVEILAGYRVHTVPSETGHSPSGDRLLHSLARNFGARACGVVLTGMGEDGARGLLALKQAGGSTLAQDAGTSVVYGMPNAAMRLGAVGTQLPLHAIGGALVELVNRTSS